MPVTVSGVRQVQTALARVATAAANPVAAHQQAARIIAGAVRAPVRTGRLQASITPLPGSSTVGTSVRYAPFQHARTPFLIHAAEATAPRWLPLYAAHIQDAYDS